MSGSLLLGGVETGQAENLATGLTITTSSTAYYDAGGKNVALLNDGRMTSELNHDILGWGFSGQILLGLDFPEMKEIGGIVMHTLVNSQPATHAARIVAYASENGVDFYEIGLLTGEEAKPGDGQSRPREYRLEGLAVKARAIRIGVVTQGQFYLNEVVVTPSKEKVVANTFTGEVIKDPEKHLLALSTELHARARVQKDFRTLSVMFLDRVEKSALDAETRKALIAGLRPLREAVASTSVEVGDPLHFKTIFPFNSTHAEVYALFGKLAATQKAQPLQVRTPNRWAPFEVVVDGEGSRVDQPLTLRAMPGETRTAGFTVGNASEKPQTVRITFQPTGTARVGEGMQLFQTHWTDTKMRVAVASVLVPLKRDGEDWLLELPAGMNQMVWVNFSPDDQSAAQEGKGSFIVSADSVREEVPVEWKVFAGRFPQQWSLNFGGWDYLRPIREGNKSNVDQHQILEIRDFLIRYGVDTPWAAQILDYGEYDDEGNMVKPPSVDHFNEWVALWPNARRFGIFNHSKDEIDGKKMGTPAFENAVRQWAKFWGDHLDKLGLKQEFLLLVIDEPGVNEVDVSIATAWASAVRSGTERFKLWSDPVFKNPEKQGTPEYWKAHDIICPLIAPQLREEGQRHVDFYVNLREAGHRLEVYSCDGPSTALDPYHYYRLQSWSAYDMAATAQTFWQLSDHGQRGLSWNEYINTYLIFTPQFIGRDGVHTSRQMEAIREGMNDYEYFVLLKKFSQRAKKAGVAPQWVAKAESLLTTAPKRVLEGVDLAKTKWPTESERDKADVVSAEMGETLSQLALALKGVQHDDPK